MLNSFCSITLVWQLWTIVRAQFARSRCVSTRKWCVMTPSDVPHRTLNVIKSLWRDEFTNLRIYSHRWGRHVTMWVTIINLLNKFMSWIWNYRVAIKGHNSIGALQASGLQGADSYRRNSLSVTAPKTDCHLSSVSSLLSECVLPFCYFPIISDMNKKGMKEYVSYLPQGRNSVFVS